MRPAMTDQFHCGPARSWITCERCVSDIHIYLKYQKRQKRHPNHHTAMLPTMETGFFKKNIAQVEKRASRSHI